MTLLASIVVVACGLSFIGFTGVVFARPALAERFVTSFASSARTHYLEQVLRLIGGASLVVLAPEMWQTGVFQLIGWAIIVLFLITKRTRSPWATWIMSASGNDWPPIVQR